MFLRLKRYLIFLFFLTLLSVFAPTASAQNKDPRQKLSVFAASEKPPKSEIAAEESRGVASSYSPIYSTKPIPGENNDFENQDKQKTADDKNERFEELGNVKINDFTTRFRSIADRRDRQKTGLKFSPVGDTGDGKLSYRPRRAAPNSFDDTKDASLDEVFQWKSAIRQSLMFLAVQHSYALTQPKTQEALKGKFFKDYIKSVKSLRGWDDGGRFFTNYIAHPLQGSFTGFIYVQNDPKARRQRFGKSADYWHSRLKAMAWTAAWSTQFEIGPISQASIGNVGLKGKQTWVDIVMTPTLGTTILVAEDAVDRFIIQSIERKINNFYVKIFSRMLLNPTRNFANLLRFKPPWHRDRPPAH